MFRASSRFRRELILILALALGAVVACARSFASGDFRSGAAAVGLAVAFVGAARFLLRCQRCRVPIAWAAMDRTSAFGWDHPLQYVNPCPRCGARQ